jgi:starch-binding outer membrane protein, SusD/RagB family
MTKTFIYIGFIIIILPGCKKYLDAKPDKSRFVVSKLSELQGLFDNEANYTSMPSAGLLASDDGYFNTSNFNSLPLAVDRNIYTWNENADVIADWEACYQKVFRMNVIIEELNKINTSENPGVANQIMGSALFIRALNHLEIAQLFASQFAFGVDANRPGIPLKLAADIEAPTNRATLTDTYSAIIRDLRASALLLPDTGLVKTRPGKHAAYGLLARMYLGIGDYESAEKYADSSIMIYSSLLDFNDETEVKLHSSNTFTLFNREVIYHGVARTSGFLARLFADSILVHSYDINDLRMNAFFIGVNGGGYRFKGGYNGPRTTLAFSGISTNEILLTRAEARARNGKLVQAMADLNLLLLNRWKANTYVDKVAATIEEALDIILAERRKELCFRSGIRWSDLRRLNREARYAVTLTRNIEGVLTQLEPNDNRYTFLIPSPVILMNNLEQNPR